MLTSNRHAFKEWASICAALAAGRQTILLRKGGIHERHGRFAVEHDEFWLFATRFHQAEDELSPAGFPFLAETRSADADGGFIRLPLYVLVTDAIGLSREERLPSLRPYHIYGDHVLANRFRYKQPGLTLLVVRAYRPPEPLRIPDAPHFAGCRTWVDLPVDVSTSELSPLLDDAEFAPLRNAVVTAAQDGTVA